jgi:hypothetical protein
MEIFLGVVASLITAAVVIGFCFFLLVDEIGGVALYVPGVLAAVFMVSGIISKGEPYNRESSLAFDVWWFGSSGLTIAATFVIAFFHYKETTSRGEPIQSLDPQEVSQVIESTFPGGLNVSIKNAMEDFSSAVKSGDIRREVKANAKAIHALLGRIESLKRNGTKLEKAVALQLDKDLLDGIVSFQQEIWKSELASSLHFEMDIGETATLDFGFFKDDPKFGKYSKHSLDTYACFIDDGRIQVRGERLVIGCNVYQITSKTKVKVRQYFDEDHAETIEIRIRGERWGLELDAYDYGVLEATTAEEEKALEEWSTFKSQLNAFVTAVEQVRGALGIVADQKKRGVEKEALKSKYSGAKFGEWIGIRPLGHGGFGQVWLAEKNGSGQHAPSQQVAIKIFSQTDFQSLKQFQSEIASLGQLHHPNIAHLIDNAKTGNIFWFATTYVGEVSMGNIVSSGAVVPPKSLQTYATQLFAALAHAHRRQIVHGDVHPGNLVLTNDRSAVVLVDFGLSAIGGFRTQEILTHVEYRAPELLVEQPQVDPKNDVYSAAITILTMARGYTPWNSRDNQSLVREIKRGAPSLAGIDESLARFLRPLLSNNPEKRPTSEDVFNHLQANGFHPW